MKVKANIPEIFVGVFLAIAIFAMGALFQSSHTNYSANQPANTQTQQIHDPQKPVPFSWDWLTHDGVVFFTFSLVFVAAIQAYLFVRQLKYMRIAAEDAGRAATAAADAVTAQTREFLAAHRPRIRIKHVYLGEDIWHGKPLVVRISCVNNGTTEANINEYGAKIFLLLKGKNVPFPDHEIPVVISATKFEIPCGLILPLPMIIDGTILSDSDHAEIRNGTKQLVCAGYVHYLDKAGRRRTTGFCRILTLPDNADVSDRGRFRVVDDPDLEYED